MRPQQQNRRMRGRGNNGGGGNNPNRKGPNPLTRNYESNGPDVKIRGSAQQIAEKYTTLARDAQSSGDRVMAENYLQHAEHYNRIIAAAQAQMPIQQVQQTRDDFGDDEDRDEFESVGNAAQGSAGNEAPAQQQAAPSPAAPVNNGSGPQPVIDGTPAEVALNSEAAGAPNGGGRHRERRQHGPRPARQEASRQEASAAAETASPETSQVNGDEGEQDTAPRRGRRPRRGERRPDQAAEASSAGQGGDDGNAAAPAAEGSGGEAALTPAES
jgi:Domain of unknown function (DUF4167)